MQTILGYIALVGKDLDLDQLRKTIHEQLPEAEEAVMTIAEQLRQEGLQQGLAIAEQRRQEGQADLLERLLVKKFGELAPEHRAQIESANEEQLARFFDRLLNADTLEAVLAEG